MWTLLVTLCLSLLAARISGTPDSSASTPPAPPAAAADQPRGERIGKTPYEKYTATDPLGRQITYYLSLPPKDAAAKLPLVVHVQGSGFGSHFMQLDDGRIGMVSGASASYAAAKDRARVLFVEKPGTSTFEQPTQHGSSEGAPEAFRREHSLQRWSTAIEAAIRDAEKHNDIDASHVLVLGHSEGGLVACKVAADLGPGTVSGVACLSGGGPTQLYDFLEMARTGHFFDQAGASPEEREKYVLDGWSGVMSEPQSPDKMWMGHSNLRWSTFCATSPMEELLKTPARVYIAQGSADQAVSPSTALMLQATLLSRGRDVRLNWIEGGDHGYAKAGETREAAGAAFNSVVADAINWFLTSVPPQP